MFGVVVGDILANLAGGAGVTAFNLLSIVVATLGAIVLLGIYRIIVRMRGRYYTQQKFIS